VNTTALFIGGLGATELLIIGAVIVMMFGATKLPELARGSGQALRIFKSETKGLMDDDDKTDTKVDSKPEATTSATADATDPTVVVTSPGTSSRSTD